LVYTSTPLQAGDRPRAVKGYLLGCGVALAGQQIALDFVAHLQEERTLNHKPPEQILADIERAQRALTGDVQPAQLR
jgi:hypothetical protein